MLCGGQRLGSSKRSASAMALPAQRTRLARGRGPACAGAPGSDTRAPAPGPAAAPAAARWRAGWHPPPRRCARRAPAATPAPRASRPPSARSPATPPALTASLQRADRLAELVERSRTPRRRPRAARARSPGGTACGEAQRPRVLGRGLAVRADARPRVPRGLRRELTHRLARRRRPRRGGRGAPGRARRASASSASSTWRAARAGAAARSSPASPAARARGGSASPSPCACSIPMRHARLGRRSRPAPTVGQQPGLDRAPMTAAASSSVAARGRAGGRRAPARRRARWAACRGRRPASTSVTKNGLPPVCWCRATGVDAAVGHERAHRLGATAASSGTRRIARPPVQIAEHAPQRMAGAQLVVAIGQHEQRRQLLRCGARGTSPGRASPRRPSAGPRRPPRSGALRAGARRGRRRRWPRRRDPASSSARSGPGLRGDVVAAARAGAG